MTVWLVVGASRGIGLEWVRQLLARGDQVYATVRDPAKASQLWTLAGSAPRASCQLMELDVSSEASVLVCIQGARFEKCVWRSDLVRDSPKSLSL